MKMKNKKNYKIAQVGSFDVENYGDLLFPELLNYKLNPALLHLFSPLGGIKPFDDNVNVFPVSILEEMCKKYNYDVIVIGGGDVIRLDKKILSSYNQNIEAAMSLWLTPIIIANKYDIPVVFNAPGVPLEFHKEIRPIVKQLIQSVDLITVRDNQSKKVLQSCGIKDVKVVADTIFNINEVYSAEELKNNFLKLLNNKQVPYNQKYLVLQCNGGILREDYHVGYIKEFVKHVNEKYNLNVLLMPIGYVHNDIEIMRKIYDSSNSMNFLIEDKLSPFDMLSIVSHSSGYVGTSMHGAITTYSYGNFILMLCPMFSKIKGFLDLIKLTENQVPDLTNLNNKFDKCFNKFSANSLKSINKEVDNHFSSLEKVIIKQNKMNSLSLYEYENCVYQQLYKSNLYHQIEIAIYYDYGNGFNDHDVDIVKGDLVEGNLFFSVPIKRSTKKVRIDYIENKYIILEDLNILVDNKDTDYKLSDSFVLNKRFIFFRNIHPQITISTHNSNKLDFHAFVHIPNQEYIRELIYEKQRNDNSFQRIVRERESLYNTYKKTLRYKLSNLYHSFLNK